MVITNRVLLLASFLSLLASCVLAVRNAGPVTYDGRSLIINGTRELLFSGSIHYPRSTPDMWPDLIKKAKKGGLNVIQTYVFWNVHEPVMGQWNFEGQNDLVKFIKLIGDNDMYVILRVGPFIQAEWNHGGLPFWLREVPGIIFRNDNEPFKKHMKRFVRKIIDMMKKERLFAPQGGPIILSQVENEYNTIQLAYRQLGTSYIQWAANMAVGLKTGVPWVMCKQKEAPNPVINSCNGRHCGDTFSGPNAPNKPTLWTENWTAQFRIWGDPPSQRSAEDIAFSIARFFSKNGTLSNYYMYHGGTNFGRTASHFTTTRYYDEAPLDEFGLDREPKYGHLKDLHKALNLCKKALLWGHSTIQEVTEDLEIITYEKPGTNICAAFLTNNNTRITLPINFRGREHILPPRSISILPDCKTVVFNTDTIVSQHNSRTFTVSETANKNTNWEMYKDIVPFVPPTSKEPLELYNLAKDVSDYGWYTTTLTLTPWDLPMKDGVQPVMRIASLGHGLLAYINGEFVGMAHGSKIEKSFVFEQPINLRPGANQIAILAYTIGLPDSGAYMEKRFAGPRGVSILGLNTGTLDLTENGWGHQVGVDGENKQIFTEEGSKQVQWTPAPIGRGGPLTWYKKYFDAPEGFHPVVIRLNSMAKGMVWINGQNIGRYWVSFVSPLGQPTQSEYHIPRSFLKPTENLLVIFEEEGGDPAPVVIETVDRDTICSLINEYAPPNVRSWQAGKIGFRTVVDSAKTMAYLKCPENKIVTGVDFASFGDPIGSCGNFTIGTCTSPMSKEVVERACMGKNKCYVPIERKAFSNGIVDTCPDITKTLAVQLRCGYVPQPQPLPLPQPLPQPQIPAQNL